MAAKFGTSGLRGLAEELLDGTAERHTAAFLNVLLAQGVISQGAPVFLGRDMRDSSPELVGRCASAIAACGLQPVDCGVLPTPALALHAMTKNAASVMVTGSHIPADRNGIKFYRPTGEITKEDEAAIIAGVADSAALDFRPARMDRAAAEAAEAYWQRYRAIAPIDALAGWRIGVWQHSTVARDFQLRLVEHFGATAVPLFRSDSFIPVDTEAPEPADIAALAEATRTHRLDAIISADADADRPLLVDGDGRQVRGDVMGVITCRFVGATHVATPVTSNSGIDAQGLTVSRTMVGSPFVIAAMEDALNAPASCVCGYEPNGGFLIGSDAALPGGAVLPALMTRDSTLPLLACLLSAAAVKQSLADHVAALRLPFATGDRLKDVPTERAKTLIARLTSEAAARAAFLAGLGDTVGVDTTDGLRMALAGGATLHVRASGNAPEMRCYAEAADEAAAHALLATGLERLRAALA
ncbi:MAG: phosphomannomutase [Rhizobiaceae bacterium]|nr:phosphomannomutase [Rhizobiaceae bacterium]